MLNIKLQIAKQRSLLTKEIREFFFGQDFTEVETPIMVDIPGMEPHLTPFETNFKSQSSMPQTPLYLNTSPELQMKKLLGAGFDNIFQISKVFRNGETGGPLHNPEFTMLEWYRTNANYMDLIGDCEKLITHLTKIISGDSFTAGGEFKPEIITPPWPRRSMNELFIEHCHIDLDKNRTPQQLKHAAKKQNLDTNACNTWDDIFFKLFLNHIEPNLPDTPIFIYDYPASQAALAKRSTKNPFFAERFELYINKIELANAFSELIDANEQRERLKQEQEERKKLKKTVFPIDEEFLAALESIQHPCAGIALGLDRLFMLLLNKKSVNDVLLFPWHS